MDFLAPSIFESENQATQVELPGDLVEQLRERGKRSLFFFAKAILGYTWLDEKIHGPICLLLEDASKKDLVICLPRGWYKSTLVSIAFPIWLAVNNPDISILLVQNTATNAHAKLDALAAQITTNEWIKRLYPELLPTNDCTWRTGAYQVPRKKVRPEATFESSGCDTQITGRHYDIVIQDDTVAPDQSNMSATNIIPTKKQIDQAIGFNKSLVPVLDPVNYRNIIVGTRWAERDLISVITEELKEIVTFYQRAAYETAGVADEKGEPSFPDKFPREVLDKLKLKLGMYLFSCLYMNKPLRSEDMIFQPNWFVYFDAQPNDLLIFTTVDLATDPEESDSGDLDYTVVMTTGVQLSTGNKYVLDYTRKRCNPTEQINMVFDHVRRWKPITVGLHAVAYEKSAKHYIQQAMRLKNEFFSIKLLKLGTQGGAKNQRIMGLQPLFETRAIFLRTWMSELVQEAIAFPFGEHDDLMDALGMQLGMWLNVELKPKPRESRDENPLSLNLAVEELRARSQRSEGTFGEMLKREITFEFN